MKIIKDLSKLIKLQSVPLWVRLNSFWWFLTSKFWCWNSMAASFQRTLNYDSAFYYLQCDIFCDLDSSFWLLPLKARVVLIASCLIICSSSGTQKLCCHVCPAAQKGRLVLCCFTCLRTSSMAWFPSFCLLPSVKNHNVNFSLKNFTRLKNWNPYPLKYNSRFCY